MSVPKYSPSESELHDTMTMFSSYDALRRAGWKEIIYAPKDIELWLIEAGSSGFHARYRDDEGSFWIVDDRDTWPSYPVLFRLQDERAS